jgi:hypothetical protein
MRNGVALKRSALLVINHRRIRIRVSKMADAQLDSPTNL